MGHLAILEPNLVPLINPFIGNSQIRSGIEYVCIMKSLQLLNHSLKLGAFKVFLSSTL